MGKSRSESTETRTIITRVLSCGELVVELQQLGEDCLVTVQGGERPHIGCAVLAIPRPSLTGDGGVSCTSSVLNATGHKDELICRKLAETVCRSRGVTTVCVGGFHVDAMTEGQIREVIVVIEGICKELSVCIDSHI